MCPLIEIASVDVAVYRFAALDRFDAQRFVDGFEGVIRSTDEVFVANDNYLMQVKVVPSEDPVTLQRMANQVANTGTSLADKFVSRIRDCDRVADNDQKMSFRKKPL